MVTLYVCSRLHLPFGPGLLAASVGLVEIGALTYLSAGVLRRLGLATAGGRQLEASLLTTFTVVMLGIGGLTAMLAP